MSLINQMLNDLDKRQGNSAGKQPMLGDVQQAPTKKVGSQSFILILVIAGAAFGSLFVWDHFRKPGSTAPAQPMLANAPATQATAPATATQPQPVITEAATQNNAEVMHSSAKAVAKAAPMAEPKRKSRARATVSKPSTFKVVSPQQQSDNLYLQAISLMQQSRDDEALEALTQSIQANPSNHNARLLSAILLSDAGKNAQAEALLQEGLKLSPGYSDFSMKLARLQVADGNRDVALATLEQGLPKVKNNPEYNAFLGALLQGKGRHDDAVHQYITALRSNPAQPIWLVGVGISLKAMGKNNDAAEAFQRALNTGELSSKMRQFAEQQLSLIRR